MSRSLVGSSSSSTFGEAISTLARYSLRFSPPESRSTGVYCTSAGKRNCSSICEAEKRPSGVSTYSAMSRMKSMSRSFGSIFGNSCAKKPTFTVSPIFTVPLSGASSPASMRSSVVLPQPLSPTTAMRSSRRIV